MKSKKLKKLITDYLLEAKLMQVATTENNQPWACSVYFAFDQSLSLYWISKSTRRHSKELKNNPKVAGTIVLPHTPGDKVTGLQFQGMARELNNKEECLKALNYYAKRFNMPQERRYAIIENKDGHLLYKIEPTLYVLFDEVNFPDDPRQEYKI